MTEEQAMQEDVLNYSKGMHIEASLPISSKVKEVKRVLELVEDEAKIRHFIKSVHSPVTKKAFTRLADVLEVWRVLSVDKEDELA